MSTHDERRLTHPLNVGYLVVGLVCLGVAGLWALHAADLVDTAQVGWLLPLTLVVAGAVGLVALAARGLRRHAAGGDEQYGEQYDEQYDARYDDPYRSDAGDDGYGTYAGYARYDEEDHVTDVATLRASASGYPAADEPQVPQVPQGSEAPEAPEPTSVLPASDEQTTQSTHPDTDRDEGAPR